MVNIIYHHIDDLEIHNDTYHFYFFIYHHIDDLEIQIYPHNYLLLIYHHIDDLETTGNTQKFFL